MTPVAPRNVNNVSYVSRINHFDFVLKKYFLNMYPKHMFNFLLNTIFIDLLNYNLYFTMILKLIFAYINRFMICIHFSNCS